MRLWEYAVAGFIPWLFVGLIYLYYHVLDRPHSTNPVHRLDNYSRDKIAYPRRKRASESFSSPSYSISDSYIGQKSTALAASDGLNSKSTNTSIYSNKALNIQLHLPPENRKRFVFVDWPLEANDLGFLNYKSLESYLASCYSRDTNIEVMIVGNQIANSCKVSGLLSKHTFLKYKRKGYNVKAVVHSSIESLFTAHRSGVNIALSVIGKKYFEQEFNRSCANPVTRNYQEAKVPPISFYYYSRIARLYVMGGEFYDLTWFHQKCINSEFPKPIKQGFYMLPYCWNTNTARILPRPNKSNVVSMLATGNFNCSSSVIMHFSQPEHPVLGCVLRQYEDFSSRLHQCLSSDLFGVRNEALKAYAESDCIKSCFDECFRDTRLVNELVRSPLISSVNPGERHYLGTNVSLLKGPDANWANTVAPILWLGGQAVAGKWYVPWIGTYLDDEIAQNDRRLKVQMEEYYNSLNLTVPSKLPCSRYQVESYYQEKHIRQASLSCTLSFVLPGFMKAGTTYLFDLLTKHPQILLTLKGVGFKESGCYYREAVSNNRSHHRMACFPFVEDHEGLTYGDGTVYYVLRYPVASYLKKENPNIKAIIIVRDPITRAESHHRFSYGQYLERGLGDMNVVVDTALEPGSRLDKIYQLILPVLETFKTNDPSQELLQEFLNVVSKFFMPGKLANATYQRAANTLFFSLYFHPIYIWDGIMGVENVYIIEAEKLDRSRSKRVSSSKLIKKPLAYTDRTMDRTLDEEMGDIFRFIGLPPLSEIPSSFEHKTDNQVPPHHQLSAKSREKLAQFYRPFNEILAIYLKYREHSLVEIKNKKFYKP